MKFTVHLYTEVRIKVINVEAENPKQAKERAEEHIDMHALLDNPNARYAVSGAMCVDGVEWAEDAAMAAVDPILGSGETDYDNCVVLDVNGNVATSGTASNEGARPQSDEIGDLLRAQKMGFSVCPDPDQPGMYYFSDPSGEGSDISFENEVAAWKQILAELPTYESMQ